MNTATVTIHVRLVRMWIPEAIGYVPWVWLKCLLCWAFLRFAGVDVTAGGHVTRHRLSLEMLDKGCA